MCGYTCVRVCLWEGEEKQNPRTENGGVDVFFLLSIGVNYSIVLLERISTEFKACCCLTPTILFCFGLATGIC